MPDPIRRDFTFRAGEDRTIGFQCRIDCAPAAPFVASSPYQVGDYLTKITDDGSRFLCVTAGTAGGSEPSWPTVKGGRVTSNTAVFMKVDTRRPLDTTGYGASLLVRDVPGGTTLASGSVANGRVAVGFSPAKWLANHAYGAGNQAVPTTPNGWIYQVETAGTSHATTEPATWPTTLGATVTDGTVVWRNVAVDDSMSNLRIVLSDTYLSSLNFAIGAYSLILTDTFGNDQWLYAGFVTLAKA